MLLIAGIRFFVDRKGAGLLVPAVTLIVTGVTALIAQLGITSWEEQRHEDRAIAEYKQRQDVYNRVAKLFVSHFNGTFDPATDAELRSLIAIWGSEDVLRGFSDWQTFIGTLNMKKGESYEMTASEQHQSKKHVGTVLSAIRKDLLATGNDQVEPQLVTRSIFND